MLPKLKAAQRRKRRKRLPAAAGSLPPTMSIPAAGAHYFGLSKNGSYDAAARGEIPFFEIGRLKRVPVPLMERIIAEGPAALEQAKTAAALTRLRAETGRKETKKKFVDLRPRTEGALA